MTPASKGAVRMVSSPYWAKVDAPLGVYVDGGGVLRRASRRWVLQRTHTSGVGAVGHLLAGVGCRTAGPAGRAEWSGRGVVGPVPGLSAGRAWSGRDDGGVERAAGPTVSRRSGWR